MQKLIVKQYNKSALYYINMSNHIDDLEEDTTDGALCVGNGDECIVFTRYLYNKVEVKQSLLFAILEKNGHESLFWTYELYYSGFHVELLEFLLNVYKEVYYETNKKMSYFINNTLNEWSDYPERVWLLGSIVLTMSQRDYDINPFITRYWNIRCHEKPPTVSTKPKFIIHLTDDDIVSYRTLHLPDSYNVMNYVCRYPIRKEVNTLFNIDIPDRETMIKYFEVNWLYYAYRSPVWKDRIDEYSGIIDHEQKLVHFPDDDLLEAFHQRWGYDTQEQKPLIKCNCVGFGNEKQLTLKDFCHRFHATPVLKKVKAGTSADP